MSKASPPSGATRAPVTRFPGPAGSSGPPVPPALRLLRTGSTAGGLLWTCCTAVLGGHRRDRHVIGRHRAVVEHCCPQDLQGQSGIVGPGVPVEEPGHQPIGAEGREVLERLGPAHPLVTLPDAHAAGQVVEPQGGQVGGGHAAVDHAVPAEQGDEEGEGRHQVRGVVQQSLALGQVLVHQAELALLEVPEPAVDQLGGLGGGPGGEVVLLHQRGAQAPAGGVEGHAGPGDAAPDDEDVEMFAGQAGQGPGAVERGANGGIGGARGATGWVRGGG